MKNLILSIDQGTTSSRAILFDHSGNVKGVGQQEFTQHFPQDGWVEHDLNDIWETTLTSITKALSQANATAEHIAGIGITNQRETSGLWHKDTLEPIAKAIVWQDRRTADICEEMREHEPWIQQKTGLLLDPYFSATKIQWLLKNTPNAQALADQGLLHFGTIETWLVAKLTGGKHHVTDSGNASRTLLMDLETQSWDSKLLDLFDIPANLLPRITSSSEIIGECTVEPLKGVPIAGLAGDQQAALFGQACFEPGMVKNTYGTGCFLLMNVGESIVNSNNRLLSTVAWTQGENTHYALEGSVFNAGTIISWLRDGLGIIKSAPEIEPLARSVPDNGGVYLASAFTGLGAPHWDPYARGAIFGLTRATSAGHLARAALEGMAFQTYEVLKCMEQDSGIQITELRVDGGASLSDYLLQFQADLLGVPVIRPKVTETTAMGAAYFAGLAVGFWENQDAVSSAWSEAKTFTPQMSEAERNLQLKHWHRAIERTKNWIQ